jgi:predicted transcriptional regulator
MAFHSISTGKCVELEECVFDELLPNSLASPISSISASDDLWIASSMLTRISEYTNNLVVLENDFPIGIIGYHEILKAVLKNPTPFLFHDTHSSEIMNRSFYVDVPSAKFQKLLKQMEQMKRMFIIIQNSERGFSSITVREILEIGALCTTNVTAVDLPEKRIKVIKRTNSVEDILKWLLGDEAELLMFENESSFIDHLTILEKITSDLNYLHDVSGFLELNSSIFKPQRPKLISDKLPISEICKTMLYMKHPVLMTANRIITPHDILQILSQGFAN